MKKPLIALAIVGAFSGPALAADARFDGFMGRVVGNQTTVTFGGGGTPLITSSAHLGNVPTVGNMGVTADASGIRLEGRAQAPVAGTAKTVPVNVKAPVSRAMFGKALMLAGAVSWPIGAIITAGEIFNYLKGFGIQELENTGGEIRGKRKIDHSTWRNMYGTGSYPNPLTACRSTHGDVVVFADLHPNGTAATCMTSSGGLGTVSLASSGTEVILIHQPEIEDLIAQESGWPTASTRALAEALNVPGVGPKIETDTPNIVGPFAVPGEKTTTTEQVKLTPGTTTIAPPGATDTQAGTKTTTKQSTSNVAYDKNVMSTTTSVSTVVNITNNVTNQTVNEGDTQQETEFPEIEVCGLPGAPACKIDETGTPEAKQDTAEKDARQAIKPLDDFIANPQSVLPEFPKINWAFTLPSGCAPIALPAFEPWLQQIDVCAFQPIFHDIMSFVWIMGGIFGAIGTFWRNTFSQG